MCPKRSGLLLSSDAFWKLSTCQLREKVLVAFSRFLHPNMKLFAVKFWCILEVLCLQALQKRLWAQFHDLWVQKWSGLLWSSDAFWMLSPFKLYKKFSGRIFHDLCVQKWNCLPWSSDAFWKFSAWEFYSKSSGRNSRICASKNEPVCREIQTHSGSSLPASFKEKVVVAIPRFVRLKTKLLAVKLSRILEIHNLRVLKIKCWAQFHDLWVQERSCLPQNSVAFRKYCGCKVYRKTCGRNSTICVQKWIGLLCSSDQGRTQGGVGVGVAWYFTKSSLPAQRRLTVFAYFLLVNLST